MFLYDFKKGDSRMNKKLWKKVAAIVLAAIVAVSLLTTAEVVSGVGAVFAQAAEIVDSGTCGDNLTWTLDSDGLLTISGKGKMNDNAAEGAWYEDRNSIKKIVIEPGVTSIGEYAFSRCFYVTEVSIPDTVKTIGLQAFWSDSRLTELTIPGSVTEIGESAFGSCSSLTCVKILDGVKTIGWKAFSECTSLTDITIPASVTDIGKDAFKRTPWLDSQEDFVIINGILVAYRGAAANVSVPSTVTKIGHGAFEGTNVVSVIIPKGVTNLGGYAFSNCKKLTSISLPDTITDLGWYTFEYCTSLPEIILPKNIEVISYGTFAHCKKLKHLVIPDKVHSILIEALYDCTELEDILIPASVVHIENSAIKISDSVIIGYSDTEAERYAKEKGYTFRSLGVYTKPLSSARITVADQIYTGKALTPAVKVTLDGLTLKEGTDYEVTYANNKDVGTATVTIKGQGNYTGSLKKNFTIKPVSIGAATLEYNSKAYTGKALKPAATVKARVDGKATTLKAGTDYKITYANNINAGTATATITGKGNYKGTLTRNFKITKAANSITKFTPASKTYKYSKTNARTFQITATMKSGTKPTYAKSGVTPSKGNSYITVSKTGKVTVKSGMPRGTYTLKVKVAAKATTNYKAKTETKSLKIVVK